MMLTSRWLKDLPPGEYLIKDLVEQTGLTASNIARQLMKHGAEKEIYEYRGNLVTYVYIWKGYNK